MREYRNLRKSKYMSLFYLLKLKIRICIKILQATLLHTYGQAAPLAGSRRLRSHRANGNRKH